MRYDELTENAKTQISWNGNPQIGWWLDSDPVTFYHGTNIKNLEFISQNGIVAPTEGSTAGWVSLALDPNTAFGYASMSGGESTFRAAGAKAVHVPKEDRIVFVIQLPQSYFLDKMAAARGHMDEQRDKLTNKEKYENWNGSDQQYYALTEIRMPNVVPANYIKGYMQKP